jgi:hypothetical protein
VVDHKIPICYNKIYNKKNKEQTMLLWDKIKAVLREQEVDDSSELIRALEVMIEREIAEARDEGYDAGQCAAESQAAFSARNEE